MWDASAQVKLKARGEPRDPETFEAFRVQDRHEEEQFRISETSAQADVTLNNDGTLDDLHRQIVQVLVRGVLQDELSGGTSAQDTH